MLDRCREVNLKAEPITKELLMRRATANVIIEALLPAQDVEATPPKIVPAWFSQGFPIHVDSPCIEFLLVGMAEGNTHCSWHTGDVEISRPVVVECLALVQLQGDPNSEIIQTDA